MTRSASMASLAKKLVGSRAAAVQRMRLLALAPFLVASAVVMAFAMASPSWGWLGLMTLLPLFQGIRVLSPRLAGMGGALWGASLAVGSWALGNSTIDGSVLSFVFLTAVPGAYAWFGAGLTRRVGFSPYLLALGWIGVEFALHPLGLKLGLLAATQGDGFALRALGSFAGYVLVAFLVAYFNAALLSAIAEVAKSCRPRPLIRRAGRSVRPFIAREAIVQLREFIRQVQPRGPPAPAFATC